VERYERVAIDIVGEITLYDPVAFLYPLHATPGSRRTPTIACSISHVHRYQRTLEHIHVRRMA